MKPPALGPPPPQQLAAYLDGELRASDAVAVEHSLTESSLARQQLEQLRAIRDALSESNREFDGLDLLPSIRTKIREGSARRARAPESFFVRPIPRPAAVLFALGLATAAASLLVALRPQSRATQDFRTKSAGQSTDSTRWAGVHGYRVRAGRPEPLSDTVAPGDGLLFSYTNLGPAPLSNLMIFGVDSNAEIHWFHPAYERKGSNPSSIHIAGDAVQAPLAELIQDEFPSGPLTIRALFSNRPLHVLDVEAWLKDDPRASLKTRVPGCVEQVLTTRVEP